MKRWLRKRDDLLLHIIQSWSVAGSDTSAENVSVSCVSAGLPNQISFITETTFDQPCLKGGKIGGFFRYIVFSSRFLSFMFSGMCFPHFYPTPAILSVLFLHAVRVKPWYFLLCLILGFVITFTKVSAFNSNLICSFIFSSHISFFSP